MRVKRTSGSASKKTAGEGWPEEEIPTGSPDEDGDSSEISVSLFDYSVENHFSAMDTIAKLCGEAESGLSQDSEVERLSSMITFLREWRHFNYQPKIIRFACEMDSPPGSDVSRSITLPQFSSAAIPKKGQHGGVIPPESSKDFVMHTGGPVWALDWCPRVREKSDNNIKCEFIAVASHPPDSSYHKMGVPLIGRGVVQIWCALNVPVNGDEAHVAPEKVSKAKMRAYNSGELMRPRGRPRKNPVNESPDNEPKKPRGRPRKNPVIDSPSKVDPNNQLVVLEPPEENTQEGRVDEEDANKLPEEKKLKGKPRRRPLNKSLDDVSEEVAKNNLVEQKKRGRPKKQPINGSSDDVNSIYQSIVLKPVNESSDVCINEAGMAPSTGSPKHGLVDKEDLLIEFIKSKKNRVIRKKKPINDSLDNVDGSDQFVQPTAIDQPELLAIEYHGNANEDDVLLHRCKKRKLKSTRAQSHVDDMSQSEGKETPITNLETDCAPSEDLVACNSVSNNSCLDVSLASVSIPKDVALPKLVLCLAHNGKVVWDVKWRPSNECNYECKQRMGYLAVLLGNGSLEVWEVPLPQTIKAIYSSSQREGTDPRFVKLKPVFRCSKLQSGGVQSIPLSVEWSTVPPHDVLLAGCHDGTVALWKFSTSCVSEDTRPLLHFTADTAPIRAVVWAPTESDSESANIIATAGHGGLKFWDIRDPYRPLWDLRQVPKIIYSMDWHQDTGCIMLTFEDGALRYFSLATSAYDVPVTGDSSPVTKQPGFHTYNYSSFAIWNVQVSPLTGMVAYCGEDGTAACFQLTVKAVEKGSSRYRAPRFLCGSVTEEESALIINTPSPYTPLPLPLPLKTAPQESSQAKTSGLKAAKVQSSDQTLALCYEDDPSAEASRTKKTPKSKSKKKAGDDQALVCLDDEAENGERGEDGVQEAGKEFECFPPKAVAMHKVRWNVNKGSERWLCFGGAAGLVRCQEIDVSYLDTKAYLKR